MAGRTDVIHVEIGRSNFHDYPRIIFDLVTFDATVMFVDTDEEGHEIFNQAHIRMLCFRR